ncbi:MAG: hypothetical protein D8M58_13670 [Calditrichaeota bacterium]|nr:MAG: hypothetical protein DWQ03_14910 [Calditrichota bacterium]MBL1206448.1 hypothetical protein [Calditrichota bacterium]NOG46275.1 hypothetical protein [Calditrichota bacterium]
MKFLIISFTLLSALFAQEAEIDSLENIVKADDQNIEAMFELAKIYHDMVVVEENDDADERPEELFMAILEIKKDHAHALAYT